MGLCLPSLLGVNCADVQRRSAWDSALLGEIPEEKFLKLLPAVRIGATLRVGYSERTTSLPEAKKALSADRRKRKIPKTKCHAARFNCLADSNSCSSARVATVILKFLDFSIPLKILCLSQPISFRRRPESMAFSSSHATGVLTSFALIQFAIG